MNNTTQLRRSFPGIVRRSTGAALALAIVLVLGIIATGSAHADTYQAIYTFAGGSDGTIPSGGVVLDAQHNLYGTIANGGAYGFGKVFKLDISGQETVLHSFTATDGTPYGVVLDAQGNLYGTTYNGGAYSLGEVYKLDTNGQFTVLYSFAGTPDGENPSRVVLDARGNLYGTTELGGTYGRGSVFKVDTTGNETVLYSFCSQNNCTDGQTPNTGVVLDAQGNLYGTTRNGGADLNNGVVFKLDTASQYTVLHSFTGNPDGKLPNGVVLDAQGNLYGTTFQGGGSNVGTVFEVYAGGGETVLYDFSESTGYFPGVGIALDARGNLYGTLGGGPGPNGNGMLFQLHFADYTWLYTLLNHNVNPYLMLDAQGNIYGDYYTSVFALLTPSAATTTTLTSAPNPATYGQAVSFTAAVSGGAGAPPNGETVTFMNVKTVLGTGALSGGSATFTTSTLNVGLRKVMAVYGGDADLIASTSNIVKQLVKKARTETALSSSPNPSAYGQAVTFTAEVTSSAGAPPDGETVTFVEGKTVLGTGTLSGGSASFETSGLPEGTDLIRAKYSGDSNFSGSMSNTVKQVVKNAPM